MNQAPQPPLPLALRPQASGEQAISAHYTEIPSGERLDNTSSGREESGLIFYWRLIRRRKGALLTIALLGGLAGVVATLPQTRLFQARGSLEIQALNADFMNMRQVDPNSPAPDYTASDAYVQTQIKILQSKSLTDRVLAKMRRTGQLVPESNISPLALWLKKIGVKDPRPQEPPNPKRSGRELANSLSVHSAGQTRVVEISADSTNPQMAADFVNTLAAEFIQQNLEARFHSSQNTGEWLTQQIDEMRTKLETSEDRLQAYARQTGLLFTSEKNNVSEEKLKQLQNDLTIAQNDRVTKQSRYEMARQAAPESLPDVLNDLTMRDDLTKVTELKRQLAELTSQYTPEHYKVGRVQAQIASIEAALQKQKMAILDRIGNDNQEALRREKLLSDAYAAQVRLVTKDAEKAIQYNILKREVDSNRQIYEGMLQKVKESGIAAAMRASNIRVVDPAEAPESPYKPSLPQNVALGILGGMLLGLAYVVTREQADRTIQQPGDAANYMHVPELGVIPSARLNAGGRYGRRLPDGNGNGNALSLNDRSPTANLSELITSQKSSPAFAESFRSALLSIVYSRDGKDSQRVLVLTSSNPSEGKTTVATNLAIAFADVKRKVLLVDGDLRKPRVHDIFGLPNDVGLSDLLQGKVSLDTPRNGVIHTTASKNLFILTSGASCSDSTVMLYADRLRELIERFRGEFDIVILDTPPMLQIPDARVMGRLADSVILVVRSGKTTQDAIVASRERLTEDGTHVLGVILNDWDPRSSSNGYYGYYDGSYKRYQQYYTSKSK